MNKGLIKNILIVFLFSITIVSVFKFVRSLKERNDLSDKLNKVRNEMVILEKEKQNLLQDIGKEKNISDQLKQRNSELRNYLKAGKIRIGSLFADAEKAAQVIEGLNSRFCLSRIEGEVLQQEKERLLQENESFKVKLSSIIELKKAIREIKGQARKVHVERKKQVERKKNIEGNRGYLIKDGKEIYSANFKIEVIPAPKQ